MRIGVAGVLGQAPAVLDRQLRQQALDEPAGSATGLHPAEAPGDPVTQPVGLRGPTGGIYAVTHGHRVLF